MSKTAMLRFFVIVAAVFCICSHVSANVKLQGPGSKLIILDKATIDYKMDYTKAYAFYNITDKYKQQFYALDVGGCKVKFKVEHCRYPEIGNRHHLVNNGLNSASELHNWYSFHDDFPFGTANPSSITFHGIDYIVGENSDETFSCNGKFDRNLVRGKYVVEVSLLGDVAPGLVVNFPGTELPTKKTSTKKVTTTSKPTTTSSEPTTTASRSTTVSTTQVPSTTTTSKQATTSKPTTVSTVQSLSTTLPTNTPAVALKSSYPQYKKSGLATWLIALISVVVVLALLAIILSVVFFCFCRRKQKAKTQKAAKSGNIFTENTISTVSTINTTSIASGLLVKKANLHRPDMMYFRKDTTPVDLKAKSQTSTPTATPMQALQSKE